MLMVIMANMFNNSNRRSWWWNTPPCYKRCPLFQISGW